MNKSTIKALTLTCTLFFNSCGGGGGGGSSAPVPPNTAPTFNSATSISVSENNLAIGYTATAIDADGDTLNYSLSGGADLASFSIDGISGELSFREAPNFEAPSDADANNTYLVGITVNDGKGGQASTELTVTITDINDAPMFRSATSLSIAENTANIGYTVIAVDDDGDSVSLSLVGGEDQALFSLDSFTGVLNINNAPDFEDPKDLDTNNIYLVEISANDGNGGSTTLELAVSVTDVSQLSAHISFPTPNANLGGSVAEITVAGGLIDSEDGVVLVTDTEFVNVNGEVAMISVNDPSRWSVLVPLSISENIFLVNVESTSGSSDSISQIFGNKESLALPGSIALDKPNNRLIVTDPIVKGLLGVDLTTGNSSIISDEKNGTGFNFGFPRSVVVDTINNRALVLDSSTLNGVLLSIDLTNGNRIPLSNDDNGVGPVFSSPESVALDLANNRVLVAGRFQLVAVDLTSGNRTIISDLSTGVGPDFQSPRDISLDIENNQVLLIDTGTGGDALLMVVDLNNGNRAILSDDNTGVGTGTTSFEPLSVVVDTVNNRALVVDVSLDAVLAVDLATGNREILSDVSTGAGTDFLFPAAIEFDATTNHVLVGDLDRDAIFDVDLINGNRSILSSDETGTGTKLDFPVAGILDTVNSRMLVVDVLVDGVLEVDLATGNRNIVSDATTGVGPNYLTPRSLALDSENNRFLIADSGLRALLEVDLSTGNRNIIFDATMGLGNITSFPVSVVLDKVNNRALVMVVDGGTGTASGTLLSVDLSDASEKIISGDSVGTGGFFSFPGPIALDSKNNRMLVVQGSGLIAVDLSNGNRSIFSDSNNGTGSESFFPQSVIVDESSNRALVSGFRLFEVDLDNGNRVVLSDENTGMGPIFQNPNSISLDNENNRAFVVDSDLKSLIVVELDSGDRAIASK